VVEEPYAAGEPRERRQLHAGAAVFGEMRKL